METKSALTKVPQLIAIAVLLASLACAALAAPVPAFAIGSSSSSSKSLLNESASSEWPELNEAIDALVDKLASLPVISENNIRLGRNLELANAEIKDDLIAIGQQSSVKKTTAKGNLLVAGWNVAIENSSADESILA